MPKGWSLHEIAGQATASTSNGTISFQGLGFSIEESRRDPDAAGTQRHRAIAPRQAGDVVVCCLDLPEFHHPFCMFNCACPGRIASDFVFRHLSKTHDVMHKDWLRSLRLRMLSTSIAVGSGCPEIPVPELDC